MEKRSTCFILLIFLIGFLSESSAKILPGESVFQLQFNKSLFISGERIWFKNSLVSGNENANQKILFVDLCGEGSIITSRILLRENDHWQGDITIPDSLETGIYLFRAYTGNYDGRYEMTSKLVTVINRFGSNQTNLIRKADPKNKPIDLINRVPVDVGSVLKIYTNSNGYKAKEIVECWVERKSAELPAGISLSVYKVPENMSNDSLDFGTVRAEDLVEYLTDNSLKVYNRLTLSGKVIGRNTKMPVFGETVLFSIPDSIPQINYATTDENGEFRFEMDDYFGQQDIFVQTLTKTSRYEIILYSNLLSPPSKIPYYISDDVENSEFVKQAVQLALLQKAYQPEIEAKKQMTVFKYPFFGVPHNTVFPDKYIEMNDFEEITKELLPACSFRKDKGKVSFRIYDQSNSVFFSAPWIMVDGIPISDITRLLPLNSHLIKKIEIQTESRCYGDLLIEGALSITTLKGNFSDIQLPANAVRTTFETFYQSGEYIGNYSVEDQNLADFREVLIWKPMLETIPGVNKIGFQSSYETGSYVAIAQTVDNNGIVHRSVCRFNVK